MPSRPCTACVCCSHSLGGGEREGRGERERGEGRGGEGRGERGGGERGGGERGGMEGERERGGGGERGGMEGKREREREGVVRENTYKFGLWFSISHTLTPSSHLMVHVTTQL